MSHDCLEIYAKHEERFLSIETDIRKAITEKDVDIKKDIDHLKISLKSITGMIEAIYTMTKDNNKSMNDQKTNVDYSMSEFRMESKKFCENITEHIKDIADKRIRYWVLWGTSGLVGITATAAGVYEVFIK